MSAFVSPRKLLSTKGPRFARKLQHAVGRAATSSSDGQNRAVESAHASLEPLLQSVGTLSLGFQPACMVLNCIAVPNAAVSRLAARMAAHRLAFLSFSAGIQQDALKSVVDLLAAQPDEIEENGGIGAFLTGRPAERVRIAPDQSGGTLLAGAPGASQQAPLATPTVDTDKAGEELLKSVLSKTLKEAKASGELAQAERILRLASGSKKKSNRLTRLIDQKNANAETRQAIADYVEWLQRARQDSFASLGASSAPREFRWCLLEIEYSIGHGEMQSAAELLIALLQANGPEQHEDRLEVLSRIQWLITQVWSERPPADTRLLDAIARRLQDEDSGDILALLLQSVASITELAANKKSFAVATAGSALVAQLASESSHRAPLAREVQTNLLKSETLAALVEDCMARKDDAAVSREILPLIRQVGDPAARYLIARLEVEENAARRLLMLQFLKSLGEGALPALLENVTHPKWYLVRNVVLALGELANPTVLQHLGPALEHEDERVQKAAVAAALRAPSAARGPALSRALPTLKPSLLDSVLDDLYVLKEPEAVPYLEKLIRAPSSDASPQMIEKAMIVLGAIETSAAIHCLLDCASETSLALAHRESALRVLARANSPSAWHTLKYFAASEPNEELAKMARSLIPADQQSA